jgi:hypothetical protein
MFWQPPDCSPSPSGGNRRRLRQVRVPGSDGCVGGGAYWGSGLPVPDALLRWRTTAPDTWGEVKLYRGAMISPGDTLDYGLTSARFSLWTAVMCRD